MLYCALLCLVSHLEVLANPPVPAASARPPVHRLAVAGVPDEGGGVGAVAAADGDGGVTGWFGRCFLHLIVVNIAARIIAPTRRNTLNTINAPERPTDKYAAIDAVIADAPYSIHAACEVVGLFIVLLIFVFYLLYRSEYLVGHLWNPRIAEGFYGFCSPLRKGDTSQSGGNPIISCTNNGLSCGEPCPSEGGQFFPITPGSCWRFVWLVGMVEFFPSCAAGVGSIPWKSM